MKYLILFFFLFILLNSCKENNNHPQLHDGMILIPAGVLEMGGDNDQADKNEFPKHKVEIPAFYMDITEVTNREFARFIEATGYITQAERALEWEEIAKQLPPNTPRLPDSLLQAGALVFTKTNVKVPLNNPQLWWKWVIGASWRHPSGPQSSIEKIMDHPVVQVSYEDAIAYCRWAGKRLPTEAEWEWASRGGKVNKIYPWGDESINEGKPKANFYQGIFPYKNTLKDGFETTAPVKSFPPNDYGLYDMSGNVWEWCEDWFNVDYYQEKSEEISTVGGPPKAYNPRMPFQEERVIRGGSFLCNDSYCSGYRNARRMGTTMDSGLNHTGFRCAKDL